MMDKGASMLLITALDDLAWILNLRGSDISFNPVFFAFGILHKDKNSKDFRFDLFIDENKVKAEAVADYLSALKVKVHPYHDISAHITKLG